MPSRSNYLLLCAAIEQYGNRSLLNLQPARQKALYITQLKALREKSGRLVPDSAGKIKPRFRIQRLVAVRAVI